MKPTASTLFLPAILFALLLCLAPLTKGLAADTAIPPGYENRCGWVDNPTPANWWLTDRDGEWLIGVQGGHQAEGDMPEFPDKKDYWVNTNGSHGYGCACLVMKVDKKDKSVLEIKSGKVLPLSQCRADKSLKPH